MKSGRKAKKTVYEKQVVFWSKKYADRARAQREEVVKKALDLVADPKKYNNPSATVQPSMLKIWRSIRKQERDR